MELKQIQKEQDEWAKKNFDNKKPYQAILGATEEIGELAHSYLKMEQGIRGTKEKHIGLMQDAVADCVIFLMDFCNQMDFDMESLVQNTWDEVKKRDWKKDANKAGVNANAIQGQSK